MSETERDPFFSGSRWGPLTGPAAAATGGLCSTEQGVIREKQRGLVFFVRISLRSMKGVDREMRDRKDRSLFELGEILLTTRYCPVTRVVTRILHCPVATKGYVFWLLYSMLCQSLNHAIQSVVTRMLWIGRSTTAMSSLFHAREIDVACVDSKRLSSESCVFNTMNILLVISPATSPAIASRLHFNQFYWKLVKRLSWSFSWHDVTMVACVRSRWSTTSINRIKWRGRCQCRFRLTLVWRRAQIDWKRSVHGAIALMHC